MSALVRVSVSIDGDLLERFDRQITARGYPTRSKAVADLMRDSLVEEEWKAGKDVAAAIILVYDHHRRDLSRRLTHIQHDYHDLIISSQHVHLDHDNCFETVVVRGAAKKIRALTGALKAAKGVKYTSVATATTGREL
ncbi:MAG: nickel-responsive transcriptional regulator NikR [Candidatus Eisenbacteria bacterium]